MKEFMDKDFLLNNDTAKILYHEHAKNMPIYDYHCHLPIKDIYEDRHFSDVVELWLVDGKFGDHYKWRALRNNGVEEKYIMGDASNKEKFLKWAETLPYTLGNPLYHWSHLELKRYFNIEETLSLKNADEIYEKMNDFLRNHGVRDIINMSNVDTICTTDDPIDDLRYHILLKEDKSFKTHVYPSFRPDKILNIDACQFKEYIDRLSEVVNYSICDIDSLEKALIDRIDFFHQVGCRIADHGLEEVVFDDSTKEEIDIILKKGLDGIKLTSTELAKYKSYINVFLGKEYFSRGWVQQYHMKALRNNSKRMFNSYGPDIGYDSINDGCCALALSKTLSKLDETNELPKTILYSLNPSDMEVIATMAFCFGEGNNPGKMQLGSGWWFLDQKDGMQKQLTALSNLGLLSRFIGMLTDSRSFLSYTRHEYFRRILCNFVGNLIEEGEYPNDIEFVGKMIEDICFNNAKKYFDENRK